MRDKAGVAVIGGGIIGTAVALRLASDGCDVLIIDAGSPAPGASVGNAGTIAAYNCVPVGTPTILRSLPRLLLHRDSPFAMRWIGLPARLPWLMRLLRQSLPARAAANAAALAGLLADSLATWRDLATEVGARDLLCENGSLYLFANHAALEAAGWEHACRAAGGVRQTVLAPHEIRALEPALAGIRGPGVFFPDAVHLAEPAVMFDRLGAAAAAKGVRRLTCRIERLRLSPSFVSLVGPGLAIEAEHTVICAGAWSALLARQASDRIPLDAERGYHIEYAMDLPPLSRPVCPVSFGVYATPMAGRLRAAGTVELGGLRRAPDPRRWALLDRAARSLLPDLPEAVSRWMGFRPSLPDSLPVIGRSRASARVLYAFGHGHLGLTLAAVTARCVATLFSTAETPTPAACSPQRFG